jgi:hypothetical protein
MPSLTLDQLLDALVERFEDMPPDAIQAAMKTLKDRILAAKGALAKKPPRKRKPKAKSAGGFTGFTIDIGE